MSNKLFSLFNDKLRSPDELVAGPAQTLDSIGTAVDDSDTILRKIRQFEIVKQKVDYSDFSNFVFFNSALDYFNVTGEKILNEYPYDGSSEQKQLFTDALDDYQRHVVNVWPKSTGYLNFNPAISSSYILVEDIGKDPSGVSKTSLLNPGTGSFSIELWAIPPPALTGTTDIMSVMQKTSGSIAHVAGGDGFALFYTGSLLGTAIFSGSQTDLISVPFVPGRPSYFCFTYDRSQTTPILRMYTGSIGTFPVLVSTLSGTTIGKVDCGSGRLSIASGSISTFIGRPLTGSLDEIRYWNTVRTLSDISSSFNVKVNAQSGLNGLWRFNESGSVQNDEGSIVRDSSGRKLHGRIQRYYPAMRSSGSIFPLDTSDLSLTTECSTVLSYIAEQQESGSVYDRDNDNIVTRLIPEQYFLLEELKQTNVLRDFMYVMARSFDQIKVSIDQFTNVLRTDYGKYNQTPDALLQDVARFFGWEFTGNFLNADVMQYIIGKNVLANTESNKALDVKLYEIKNEFWKRTLINLMHIYKTKGTRDSVESLLRVYGVNGNFVKLKEYGYKPEAGIQTTRISSEKSVAALTFGSGSSAGTNFISSSIFYGPVMGVETRIRFPTETSAGLDPGFATGSIWLLNSGSTQMQSLIYQKTSVTSTTGSFTYSGSEGSLTLSNVPVFDNRWCNLVVNHDYLSSSLEIDLQVLDRDDVVYHASASLFTPLSTASYPQNFIVGADTTSGINSEYWMQEARVWTEPLGDIEMRDHALNFQSFGTEEVDGLSEIILHWRMNENLSASAGGELLNTIYDYSGNSRHGSGNGFTPSDNPFRKFLNEFNYIASPEFGWSEEKIRSIAASTVSPQDAFTDNAIVALEFNLVDALNEDISQILATLDTFNESIGSPVHRYRDSYVDLDILRANYFKRLNGAINFKTFADLLEFFDRSFIDMIRRLIPARATFLGDEFIVESHMLERPKLQWNYRRKEREFQPEGVIKVFIRS